MPDGFPSPYKLILTKTKDLFKADDLNFFKILEGLKLLRMIDVKLIE